MILTSDEAIQGLLQTAKTVAVLGIKTQAQSAQPSYYVPKALQEMGLRVIPVPVYYPDVTEILGEKVFRDLRRVPVPIDIVDVFRTPPDIEGHVEEILATKPKAVWFQAGIRHDAVATRFAEAGIQVVQDRCLMVDYRRLASPR